jgi:hypothetical protein
MFYLLFKYAIALLILNKKREIVKDDILAWHVKSIEISYFILIMVRENRDRQKVGYLLSILFFNFYSFTVEFFSDLCYSIKKLVKPAKDSMKMKMMKTPINDSAVFKEPVEHLDVVSSYWMVYSWT